MLGNHISHGFLIKDKWTDIFWRMLNQPQNLHAEILYMNTHFLGKQFIVLIWFGKRSVMIKKVMKYYFRAWLPVPLFPQSHPSGIPTKFYLLYFPNSACPCDGGRTVGYLFWWCLTFQEGGGIDDFENLKGTMDSLPKIGLHYKIGMTFEDIHGRPSEIGLCQSPKG